MATREAQSLPRHSCRHLCSFLPVFTHIVTSIDLHWCPVLPASWKKCIIHHSNVCKKLQFNSVMCCQMFTEGNMNCGSWSIYVFYIPAVMYKCPLSLLLFPLGKGCTPQSQQACTTWQQKKKSILSCLILSQLGKSFQKTWAKCHQQQLQLFPLWTICILLQSALLLQCHLWLIWLFLWLSFVADCHIYMNF